MSYWFNSSSEKNSCKHFIRQCGLILNESMKAIFFKFKICAAGSRPAKYWHCLTVSKLKVPNIFINTLFQGFSKLLQSVFEKVKACIAYKRDGSEIEDISFKVTIGLFILPILL